MAEYSKHPFLLTVEETAQALGTDVDKGLTSAQVTELQAKYPPNELDVGGSIPWYKIFAKQLFNAMILVSRRSLRYQLYSVQYSSYCRNLRHYTLDSRRIKL
jgi:magnesium-transporting ATPase (P-type)